MPYRTVTGALIQDGTVATADLADGAVTGPKIAGGAVGAAQLGAGAVEAEHLCGGAVTGSKIANGAVGSSKIASGAVGSSQIVTGAVGSSELASGLSIDPTYVSMQSGGGIYGPTNGDFQAARSGDVTCESTCDGNIVYCNCGSCAGCLFWFDAYNWQWKAICGY